MLVQVNGNLEKFTDNLTTGYEVVDGYNLQLQSMTNQLKLAKNNLDSMGASMYNSLKGGFLPFIQGFNTLSKSISNISDVFSSFATGFITFFSLSVAGSAIKNLWSFGVGFLKLHPAIKYTTLALSGLVTVFSLFNTLSNKTDKNMNSFAESMKKISDRDTKIKTLKDETSLLTKELEKFYRIGVNNNNDKITSFWENYSKTVGAVKGDIIDINEELKDFNAKQVLNSIESFRLKEAEYRGRIETLSSAKTEQLQQPVYSAQGLYTGYTTQAVYNMREFWNRYKESLRGKEGNQQKYEDFYNSFMNNINNQKGLDVATVSEYAKSYEKMNDFIVKFNKYDFAKDNNLNQLYTIINNIQKYELSMEENRNARLKTENQFNENLKEYAESGKKTGLNLESSNLTSKLLGIKDTTLFLSEFKKSFGIDLIKKSGADISNLSDKTNSAYLKAFQSSDMASAINNWDILTDKIKEYEDTVGLIGEPRAKQSGLIDTINYLKGLRGKVFDTFKFNLGEAVSEAIEKGSEKGLQQIDFKTIQSNMTELQNEFTLLGLSGIEALVKQSEILKSNLVSNQAEIKAQLRNLGVDMSSSMSDTEGYYSYVKQYYENKYKDKASIPENEVRAYNNAVDILTLINKEKELGAKFDIESYKNTKAQADLQKKYLDDIIKEAEVRSSIKKSTQETLSQIKEMKVMDFTGTILEPLTKLGSFGRQNTAFDKKYNPLISKRELYEARGMRGSTEYLQNEQDIANLEKEKLEIQKEQVQYGRQLADTLYDAFKSGDMGAVGKSILGGLGNLGGAVGSSMGGVIGGFAGQLAGNVLGGALDSLFFAPEETRKKNEEYANKLLEDIKALMQDNNAILNSAYGNVSSIGSSRALQQGLQSGSLSATTGKYSYRDGGFLGLFTHEDTASYELGLKKINSYKELVDYQKEVSTRIAELNAKSSLTYNERAEKQAFEQRLAQVNDLVAKSKEYAEYSKDAYAGFEVTIDKDTNKVSENWDKTYAQIVSDLKSFKSVGSMVGTLLFTGIRDAIVGENSAISMTLDSLSSAFKSFFRDDSKDFGGITSLMKELTQEQQDYNSQLNDMMSAWSSAGESISDIIGMTSELTQNIYSSILSAFDSTDFSSRFNTISDGIGKSLLDKVKKSMLDKSLSSTFLSLNQTVTDMMSRDTSISDIISLRTQIEQASVKMNAESAKVKAMTSLLNMGDTEYTSSANNITYSTGSTTSNVYNFNNAITISQGTVITTDKEDRVKLAQAYGDEFLNYIEKKVGKINK